MRLEVVVDDVGLRGSLIAEHKRCGRPNCRCARGELHGPYYYRRWRDSSGRQRKQYVPRERVEQMRRALQRARSGGLVSRLRELRKSLDELARDSRSARGSVSEQLGRYWHGRELRERRSIPSEQRDRTLYRLNQEGIVAALGWEIAEDDFVVLRRMMRSERKRRNRLGVPWRETDPATGQEVIRVTLNLWELPSYRAHIASQAHHNGSEVDGRGEADR